MRSEPWRTLAQTVAQNRGATLAQESGGFLPFFAISGQIAPRLRQGSRSTVAQNNLGVPADPW